MFSFFVLIHYFLFMFINIWLSQEIIQILFIIILWILWNSNKITSFFFNPFLFHCFTKTNFSYLFSNFLFHGCHWCYFTDGHIWHKLKFRWPILSIGFAFVCEFDFFSFYHVKFYIFFCCKRLKSIIKSSFLQFLFSIKVFCILNFSIIIDVFKHGFFNVRHILPFHSFI